ncbi:MAG: 4-hydroxy-tetrahydrodipicolinate reductase [Sphingobacteriales bacterium]|nr:4-hydroxy-tetrahydrodipicolinate reductase [Sphingobacteriales bacterium]NCT76346.1 4-hydroxy-tetrahydrodipicolinate reductase [Chitinophagaceae bacterium]OJW33742.1 MAG: 4-hydroxy-tetrahydrodipicolinate reductase [Sphingobacteriales bacterium 46-32]
MNIALIGYGKMGKAIEEIALQRGHHISARINEDNLGDFNAGHLAGTDVAIEFTSPHSAFSNITSLLQWGIPVVCGSTGWTEQLPTVEDLCRKHQGAFLYASNFSVGVNLFFELNKKLAALMASHPEYDVVMEEIHHTQKKDAPSGTAITLAEQVLQQVTRKKNWVNEPATDASQLAIISKREDPAPGTHSIRYTSSIDDIEIIHTAHSRKGFASGAVVAAEFLKGKTGIFSMKEVLGL